MKRSDALLIKTIDEHDQSAHERERNLDFLDILIAKQESLQSEKLSIANIKPHLLVCSHLKSL